MAHRTRETEPSDNELVSIGVPVRNAEQWIEEALLQLVGQSHRKIEIIISDNNSADGTEAICRRYADGDDRISYTRQSITLRADENFRFVLERAQGKYFMWAAHDDRRSLNYVEVLLTALQRDPGASLAFSEVAIFHELGAWTEAAPIKYDFACDGKRRFWRGLMTRDYIRSGYLHIYGLIRKAALEGYGWPFIEVAADRPLLLFLWRRGRFVQAEGARFYCYKPARKKTAQSRATQITGAGLRPFAYTRLSWICAQAAKAAEALEGRYRNGLAAFLLLLTKEVLKRVQMYVRYSVGKLWRLARGASQ